jgi:hypothetical protein
MAGGLRNVNAVVTITTNAVKAIEDGKKLKEVYAAINQQLNLMRAEGKTDTTEFKEMQKLAEDTKLKIDALVRGMELIRGVVDNLANKQGRDLNRALREISKEFNKTGNETDADKAKLEELANALKKIKEDQSIRRGLTMPLEEAKKQLQDLTKVSPEKLVQGLDAVKRKISETTDAAKRTELQGYAKQYEAQMAVNQYGRAGSASLSAMNAEQLRAEQARLKSGYMATEGAQGYEAISKEYIDRLHEVNKALTERAYAQQKADQAVRDGLAAKDQSKRAYDITEKLIKKEKVSLEELTEVQKIWREQLKKYEGVNVTDPNEIKEIERLNNNLKITDQQIADIQARLKNINVGDIAKNPKAYSIDELNAASKFGKEQFARMKPTDQNYEQLRQDLIAIDTEIERVTPKWNELAQAEREAAKANDVINRAWQGQKVTMDELLETQKILEAQIKKMEGLNLSPTEHNELQREKIALEGIKIAIDDIMEQDLDFDNLDTAPVEKLEAALKNLEQQEKRLTGQQKDDADLIARKKALIQQQLQRNKAAVQGVADAEKVAAETGKYNVNQLKAAYETLQQKLMSLNTGQKKQIEETRAQMQKLKQAIDDTTGSISNQNSIWKTAVRNITAYVGVFGTFNLVKNKLMEIIRGGEQLSDQMAQVRMVSGLAMSDIEELTRRLAKVDTRTTLEELTQLSYAGAKLGFGEGGIKGLEDFVSAANQVNVALREDLGDEALTALSKITENMGLIKKMGVEQAMLSTSSAMFKLAATSTAAAGPIVEVTKRLAPVAQMSGFATHEILALASASDSLQLMPEVVGTALSKLIMAMQNNHNLIEKYLTIPEGTIASMFKAGHSMDALMLVFDKMRGKNVTELDNLWKLLGSDGQRLITVVADMANHNDTLAKHLETSTKAFKEATAVTEEYNIQQETAMAYLLRAENLWHNAFVNPDSSLSVKEMTKAWYDFTKSILDSELAMGSIKLTVDLLLLSLRILINLLPAIAFGGIAKMAKLAGDKIAAMKIATDGFITSWKKMDAATKSNWIGLMVGLAAQLVFWLREAARASGDVEKEQKKMSEAIERAHEKVDEEIGNLNRLKKQIDDTNLSQEDRNKLLSKVRTDYDIYLNYLGVEIKTVDELAKHYDALTKVMRQRFAYQEREEYKRDVMGGEDGLRMKRRNAGADLRKQAAQLGIKELDLDAEVMPLLRQGANVEQIMAVIAPELKRAADNVSKSETAARTAAGPGAAVGNRSGKNQQYLDFKSAVQTFVDAVKREQTKETEIDAAFASEIGDFDYDKWLRTQVQGDFKIKPDKEAIKEAKKAAQERKKELKLELDQAKKNSDAVISKVEEWYRLQETAITAQFADGILSEKESKDRIRELNIYKNQALEYVRSAITGRDTESWDEFKQNMGAMMMDTGNWSKELLSEVQQVNVDAVRSALLRFNGSAEVLGISATSVLDAVDKNAAGNKRERTRLEAEAVQMVEDLLEKYHYFDQARDKFYDDLMSIGAIGETAEEMADRMQQGGQREQRKDILPMVEALANRFRGLGTQVFSINPDNAQEIADMIAQMIQDHLDNPEEPAWTLQFPNIMDWMQDAEVYETELKNFYQVLLKMESDYYKASKSQYELYKKENEQAWENSGRKEYYDVSTTSLGYQQQMQDVFGTGQSFGQQYGFVDAIAEDPEVKLYQEKLRAAAEYYQFIESRQHTEQELREAGQAALEAYLAMAQKVSSEVAERASKIQELQEPATTFVEEVGQKWGDMMFNMESSQQTWNQIVKKMILGFATMTIKMTAENLTKKIQQALFYKQMLAMETEHQTEMLALQVGFGAMRLQAQQGIDTALQAQKSVNDATTVTKEASLATILTAMGISEGAAKIIGQLGWWGIPLIAVISALLMGLLTSALSTAGKSAETSNTAAKTNVKLKSDMLTYDEGNVQNYVGNDGHVYRAWEAGGIPEGVSLVKQPIATTVNGQPSLVAEKGPEIVIGRRTTARIMMNEPRLLHHLATLGNGRSYGGYRGLRTFDAGNLDDITLSRNNGITNAGERNNEEINAALAANAAALEQNAAAMAAFSQVMQQIQANGIQGVFREYGAGSLDESMRKVNAFRKRYPTG